MLKLPWSERVNMLSINPDAATRDDIARMAAELSEVKLASANSKSVPCCDVCGGPLRSDGDCSSRIAHLYGE
jgi:hypothetical protein